MERPGQGHGNLDRGIGVVALADVQQTRNAADVAEFQLVETVLAAGQREDHAVVGQLLRQFRKVVPAGLRPVATADEEEVADLPLLDGVDDLVGHAQHGIAAEADGDGLRRGVGHEAGRRQGRFDHRRETSPRKSGYRRVPPTCCTPGQATSPLVKMRPL